MMSKDFKFTSKKQVDEYFSGDEIECLICNKTFKSVGGRHLTEMHGINARQYKQKFGLPLSRGLSCDSTREKTINVMLRRHERKDPTLNPMTKELAYKAHHSLKKIGAKRQSFTSEIVMVNLDKALTSKKTRSQERINKIDWDKFLSEVEKSGKARWGLRERDTIPSCFSLQRKMENDPEFKRRYQEITERLKLKNRYREMVLQMTCEGMSAKKISAVLPISKTHIKRIRHDQQRDDTGVCGGVTV